jgi:uncharacterized membrane protein
MDQNSPKLAISTDDKLITEKLVFHAKLSPHRSLGPKGHAILFTIIILFTSIISIPFYLLGALPVVGFLGLDVVLLWFAFRVSNNRAKAYEELMLSHVELLVRRMSWRGRLSQWSFNPLWVKLSSEEHPEYGMQRILLAEGKRSVEMGAFLGPDEKADFMNAFKHALATARQGPRIS